MDATNRASLWQIPILGLALAAAAFGGSACVTTTPLRVAEPVGPDPRMPAASEESGTLVVFTDIRESHPTHDDYSDYVRLPYVVFDAAGRELARVKDNGYRATDPQQLRLPPGSYLVRGPGLGARQGLAVEPEAEAVVRIDRGRTTVLHFDEPWMPPSGYTGKGLVSKALPDWRVGWSAHAAARLGIEGEMRYVGSPMLAKVIDDARAALPGMTFEVAAEDQNCVGELALGTAGLAGVAGEVHPPDGIACKVVGFDQLVLLVRPDSPLQSLSAEQVRGLLAAKLKTWSQLAGSDARPIVLLAGAGTGAEQMAANAAAVPVDSAELLRRVANSTEVIALTSRAAARQAKGVREISLAPETASGLVVPLSLCGGSTDPKAQAVVHWAISDAEQSRIKTSGLRPAIEPEASASRR